MEEGVTQLCSSDTQLLGLLFCDLLSFCSFLASHPVQLAYFLFFSPYLFQLLSFLSPLLLSTSLLLLVLLTVSPQLDDPPRSPPELFRNTCFILLNILQAKLEVHASVELLEQLASVVLAPVDDASPYFQEPFVPALVGDEVFDLESRTMGEFCNHSTVSCVVEESQVKLATEDRQKSVLLVSSYEIGDKNQVKLAPEDRQKSVLFVSSYEIGDKNFDGEVIESPFMDALEDSKASEFLVPHIGMGDNSASDKAQLTNKVAEDSPKAFELENSCNVGGELTKSTSRRRNLSIFRGLDSLQRDNSMRKEREWKRTLACKLYEERMTYKLCEERTVVEGGEEMDLLWEAYEVNATKDDKLMNNGKKERQDEKEEEDEEDEETVGPFCCLQALRLSAGKMNLGVGRPNLVKISKVLKGMATFQRIGRRSRKG